MCSFVCRSTIRMSIRFAVCLILVYSRFFIHRGEFFCLSNYVDIFNWRIFVVYIPSFCLLLRDVTITKLCVWKYCHKVSPYHQISGKPITIILSLSSFRVPETGFFYWWKSIDDAHLVLDYERLCWVIYGCFCLQHKTELKEKEKNLCQVLLMHFEVIARQLRSTRTNVIRPCWLCKRNCCDSGWSDVNKAL